MRATSGMWLECWEGWYPNSAYTLRERGQTYSVALYEVFEIWHMRDFFKRTLQLAQAHNSSGPACTS